MHIQVIEYTSSGHEGMVDNDTHLQGSDLGGEETLCGNVNTFMKYDVYHPVDMPVTCPHCQEIYESIKKNRKKVTFKQQ